MMVLVTVCLGVYGELGVGVSNDSNQVIKFKLFMAPGVHILYRTRIGL